MADGGPHAPAEAAPAAPIAGTCDARFAAVRRAFVANFAEHGEIGAAVAVMVDGRPVVDLWGGYADAARRIPWRRDTLVNVFSVGKALATVCVLRLVDRGRLALDAAVGRLWPEFAAAGKGTITVRQLLCHRAGLPAIWAPLAPEAIFTWETMTTALAREAPWWPPGTRHGYHVNTFGFLVGEVVRRPAGRSAGSSATRSRARSARTSTSACCPTPRRAPRNSSGRRRWLPRSSRRARAGTTRRGS